MEMNGREEIFGAKSAWQSYVGFISKAGKIAAESYAQLRKN